MDFSSHPLQEAAGGFFVQGSDFFSVVLISSADDDSVCNNLLNVCWPSPP